MKQIYQLPEDQGISISSYWMSKNTAECLQHAGISDAQTGRLGCKITNSAPGQTLYVFNHLRDRAVIGMIYS
jgi:hypothetical protein